MSSTAMLQRALLLALAALALSTPTALARPIDLRSEAPTSALSGTPDQPSPEVIPGNVFRRSFGLYSDPLSRRGDALAQERYYSTYGEPAPPREAAVAVTDSGDGITWLLFVLGLFAALVIGLGAGSGLQARRHTTRPAT
jgi:hypothetical protein